MKLWMVHPRLDRRGGAEHLIRDLCTGLLGRGHDVAVAAGRFDAGVWPDDAWKGVHIETLERASDRFVPRRWRAALRARRLAGWVRDADAVIAHNFPATLWVAGCAAPGHAPRRLWYCHEPPERLYGRDVFATLVRAGEADAGAHPWAEGAFAEQLARIDARRPRATVLDRDLDGRAVATLDGVLANSAFTANAVERVYGRPATPCPPGVDLPDTSVADERDTYVAWVTNPRVAKNAHAFLEALRLCRERAPDLRVRALGLDEALRAKVARLGLDDVVAALPPQDDACYAELIAGARLVVYPSLDEPFGLVPIEAMARGRPVLATRSGGPAESVVDDETGLLVDPLDPRALGEALLALWNDPTRCDALGAAGRARYQERFTLDAFLDRFEAAIQRA